MSRLLRRSGRYRSGGGGIPTPAPHRYWRVKGVTLQGGVGNFSINTLQMRATSGGADQCSGGTAISDSNFDGTVPASNAFDGNDATLWSSTTGGSGHWIGYDFGSPVSVLEIRIVSRSDYLLANAISIVIEYSDNGSTWTTSWSHTLMGNWSAGEARVFTKPLTVPSVTRWRVLILANYLGNNFASMAEFQLRSTAGGADIAGSATLTADSDSGAGFTIAEAHDGNGATFWTSSGASMPHWFKAVFGSPAAVAELTITARTDVPTLAPATLYIQYSTDDVIWTDSILLGYAGVTSGETKVFGTLYSTV